MSQTMHETTCSNLLTVQHSRVIRGDQGNLKFFRNNTQWTYIERVGDGSLIDCIPEKVVQETIQGNCDHDTYLQFWSLPLFEEETSTGKFVAAAIFNANIDLQATYEWTITGSSSSQSLNGSEVDYSFPGAGQYKVILITTYGDGTQNRSVGYVFIANDGNLQAYILPNIQSNEFDANSDTSSFDDTLNWISEMTILGREWNINGQTDTGEVTQVYQFSDDGEYLVTLSLDIADLLTDQEKPYQELRIVAKNCTITTDIILPPTKSCLKNYYYSIVCNGETFLIHEDDVVVPDNMPRAKDDQDFHEAFNKRIRINDDPDFEGTRIKPCEDEILDRANKVYFW